MYFVYIKSVIVGIPVFIIFFAGRMNKLMNI